MNAQLITVDPEIHSGTPVFFGTRVPIPRDHPRWNTHESKDCEMKQFGEIVGWHLRWLNQF